ncbi:MAG: DUF3192 domain-containing protein [Gammaproteobacteria bacterium]|nr:DUF3192 domain-containing protein [Gammaproteobacteria bacterium]
MAGTRRRNEFDRLQNELYLGRALVPIEAELGVPGFADSFMINGEAIRVLYDRTHHSNSDGKTTRDESTLLAVIDDQLVGCGEITIEKATR